MKVSCNKDLANHVSPEPHGDCGNAIAAAWVWESAGGTLSSEINEYRVPTSLCHREGHIFHSDIASHGRTRRSQSLLACTEASCAKIGRSGRSPLSESWNRIIQPTKISWCIEPGSSQCKHRTRKSPKIYGCAGKGEKPYVQHKIFPGSRTQHSTVEAGEQGDMSPPAELVEGRT